MKYLILLFITAAFIACNSGDKPATDTAVKTETTQSAKVDSTTIQWLDSTHQFLGKINDGAVVEVAWRFVNSGDKPLIISNVNAGCGCTVAEKPEAPVAPGKEGIIRASFNSQGQGPTTHKTVTVIANTKGQPQQILSFGAEVVRK